MIALKILRPSTLLIFMFLVTAGILASFGSKTVNISTSGAAYLIGEVAKEDLVVWKMISVVDPVSTELQRQTAASKIPIVLQFDRSISDRAVANFSTEFVFTHDRFLDAVERTFKTRALTTNQIGLRFRKMFDAFHAKNRSYPVGVHEAESWALQPLDQNRIKQMSAKLRKSSERLIRPETFSPTNLTSQVRIVSERTVSPSMSLIEQQSRLVRSTDVVGLMKVRNEVRIMFGKENPAVQKYMADHVQPTCNYDEELTRQFHAEKTNAIWVMVPYEIGQIIVHRGDLIDARAKAVLDKLKIQAPAFPEEYGARFWLWTSSVFCALLALMVSLIRFAGRSQNNLVPAGNVLILPSFITANDDLRTRLAPHLVRGLMNRFVRALISQRSELLETQNSGTDQLTEIEQQLEEISVRLETRQKLYESRIAELEKELTLSKEENRELIRTKIHEARQNLEWAKTHANEK